MSCIDYSPLTDATVGGGGRDAACPALPDDPTFIVSTQGTALALLQRMGRQCPVIRASRWMVFAAPLVIVYDERTGCAWLCSVTVDGRLATVEATATWGAA